MFMFHYTVESQKTFEEAIDSIEVSLKENGFGVLWKFNIPETLAKKGVEFDKEFMVLEVCNPHEAKRVLSENSLVGYFLPCKIVIYKEQNQTKIGMPKPSSLIGLLSDENLIKVAKDIETRLIRCIDQAK